ncbi:MAG: VCBS repeat-containing protein [Chloroflexota bacterium]
MLSSISFSKILHFLRLVLSLYIVFHAQPLRGESSNPFNIPSADIPSADIPSVNVPSIQLSSQVGWESSESYQTFDLALGDVDKDGDLDLAVVDSGRNAPIRLYLNHNGTFAKSASWTSTETQNAYSVAWGDVDNDGDLDLAVGNYEATNLLYLNDGHQLNPTPVWQSTEVDKTYSVAWGDVNGDGYLDLAIGNGDSDGEPNRIYLNQQGILESTASWASTEFDDTRSVAWADVDNDQQLDLAAGNDGQPSRLYKNTGQTLNNTANWVSDLDDNTQDIAWGDVNNDGYPDLAVANEYEQDHLYINQGGILPPTPTWHSNEDDVSRGIAWGDVDADGDVDLVVALDGIFTGNGANIGRTRIYLNQEGQLSASESWRTADSHYAQSVAVGDISHDGFLDLVIGTTENNKAYFSLNQVLGPTPKWVSEDNDNTRCVAWGDVDGDGSLELAAGNWGQLNTIYLNQENVQLGSTWASDDSTDSQAIDAGDFDKDGDLDLAIAKDGANLVYRNDNGVIHTPPIWTSDDTDDTWSIAWGDVNNDGYLDLAIGNDGSPNKLYLNNQGVLQRTPSWASADDEDTQEVVWGDIDNDGDLDLAALNRNAPDRVYINVAGQLAPDFWASTEDEDTWAIAWADLDGNQQLDLIVGNSGSSPTRVYFNSGNGQLAQTATWASTELGSTFSIALADMDKDGDLDLAIGNSRANHVYVNGGSGLPQTANWISTETERTRGVAWGDINNDGYLELAVATEGGFQGSDGLDKVYLNVNGTLQTTAFWAAGNSRDETTSVAWGDVNQDGYQDLVFGLADGANRLYLNQNGTFQTTPIWESIALDATQSVAWGDLNGDTFPELAVGNNGVNKVYLNQSGVLETIASWTSTDRSNTYQIMWGDVDNDGDLDLIIGNDRTANRIYMNTDGQLATEGISLGDDERTQAIALGDFDNNQTLDLAVGNDGVNKILLNNGGAFQVSQWIADEEGDTYAGSWGDVDNDGYLDLVAGDRLFHNQSGQLETRPTWTATEENNARSVALGDWNRDGYLDLALGNRFHQNRIYTNLGGIFNTTATWTSAEAKSTYGVAWSDLDLDRDLDLAVGDQSDPDKLYLNQDGYLSMTPSWLTRDEDDLLDILWADINNDGYPDLITANEGEDKIYMNQTGVLQSTATWSSSDADKTSCIAWGDVDGDGDLDLAVANDEAPNKVYLNDNGILQADGAWISQDDDESTGLAWADVDGDGDLDLAVANDRDPTKVYLNEGQELNPIAWWQSADDDRDTSLAWGDVDNDGDLDLAVGVFGRANKLYLNQNSRLTATPIYFSSDEDETASVAWGDMDGDGDLDLAVGNQGTRNKVYLNNQGSLAPAAHWTSAESDSTRSIAWGDWDGDGDLDLAAGNSDATNKVYLNRWVGGDITSNQLSQEAVWQSTEVSSTRTIVWGDWDNDGDLDLAAGNYGAPNVIYLNRHQQGATQATQPAYARIDKPNQGAYFFASPQIIQSETLTIGFTLFNPAGESRHQIGLHYSTSGGAWYTATLLDDADAYFRATPAGIQHNIGWHIGQDLIRQEKVTLWLVVFPENSHYPVRWPATTTQSQPFRFAAPWYAKVVDGGGNPIEDASVYHLGAEIGRSNQAGLLRLPELDLESQLAALSLQATEPTVRTVHNEWAYKTYTTNMNWDNASSARMFTVQQAGEQKLTVQKESPLILFNLVVSIEWDAGTEYFDEIEGMVKNGSKYLLDLSDGQMALEQVVIYDNAEHWSNADIRIFAKNRFRPYAYIGGLTAPTSDGAIHLGRQWDRNRGSGLWNAPDGYRTFIHEFGHYALNLYDEYFVYVFDEEGNFVKKATAFCTAPKELLKEGNATASAMYWQYVATELSAQGVPGLWTPSYNPACEQTEQWRRTRVEQGGTEGESTWETLARVYADEEAAPRWQIVTPIDRGHIMTGPVKLPTTLPVWPEVSSINSGAEIVPRRYLSVSGPDSSNQNAFVTLYDRHGHSTNQGFTDRDGQITIYGATSGSQIRVTSRNSQLSGILTVGSAQELNLSLESVGSHLGNAEESDNAQGIDEFSESRMTFESQNPVIYSQDGATSLYVSDGSLDSTDTSLIILAIQTHSVPLPEEWVLYSEIYKITTDSGQMKLKQPAILEIRYDHLSINSNNAQIIWNDPTTDEWQLIPSRVDSENRSIYAAVANLGAFAIVQVPKIEPNQLLFIPYFSSPR